MVCSTMIGLSQSFELQRFEYYVHAGFARFLKLPITFQLMILSGSKYIGNNVNISYNETSCQISKITAHAQNTENNILYKVTDNFLQFSLTIFCCI